MNCNKSPLILNWDPIKEKSPLAKNEKTLTTSVLGSTDATGPWGCLPVQGTKTFPLQRPREMGKQAGGTWARLALRLQPGRTGLSVEVG